MVGSRLKRWTETRYARWSPVSPKKRIHREPYFTTCFSARITALGFQVAERCATKRHGSLRTWSKAAVRALPFCAINDVVSLRWDILLDFSPIGIAAARTTRYPSAPEAWPMSGAARVILNNFGIHAEDRWFRCRCTKKWLGRIAKFSCYSDARPDWPCRYLQPRAGLL